MKKNEFDGLTRAVDFLEAAKTRVHDVAGSVQSFVNDAEGTLNRVIDEALGQVRNRLQDSPLEDPVVPTSNWGAATDDVNPATAEREDLIKYLVNLARTTGTSTQFSNEDYVQSLPTSQLRTIAAIMKKVTDFTRRLK